MSTKSSISIYENEIYAGVYCHNDGYLSHNGRILLHNYTTAKDVKELISFGDMSSLGEKISPDPSFPHTRGIAQNGVCVFYHRDDGESKDDTKAYVDINEESFYAHQSQQYDYLFKENKWFWRMNGKGEWKPLTEADLVS